jgi:hypothetical protein
LGAELGVDLDAGDTALRPDSVRHQPHDGAGSCANVERAHAWPKTDLVEHRLGRGLPHARLIAQALIFVRVSRVDIAVRMDLPRLSRHSPRSSC